MDVIEALAFERDISPKALTALASPHRTWLCCSYQPQEVDRDFEELVRYDREFPHCTEHEDDVVPVQVLNNSTNQVLGCPGIFLGRAQLRNQDFLSGGAVPRFCFQREPDPFNQQITSWLITTGGLDSRKGLLWFA